MKKKNLKALKLNKKSISKLQGNSMKGGTSYVYSELCTIVGYTCDCTVNCTEDCPETETCPSSWINICNDCGTTV
jgi:hypothetical protein